MILLIINILVVVDMIIFNSNYVIIKVIHCINKCPDVKSFWIFWNTFDSVLVPGYIFKNHFNISFAITLLVIFTLYLISFLCPNILISDLGNPHTTVERVFLFFKNICLRVFE